MQQERIRDYPLDQWFTIPGLDGYKFFASQSTGKGRKITLAFKGPNGVSGEIQKPGGKQQQMVEAKGAE